MKMLRKVFQTFRNDQRGMQLIEQLVILGIVVILLGVTFFLLKTPVTAWWNTNIMNLFAA